jgi:FMN phosphatase YigB (HAD superfamily)
MDHPYISDLAIKNSFSVSSSEFNRLDSPKIAVVAHVYYIDLFKEICSFLKNIPSKYTLLVSLPKEEYKSIIMKDVENLLLLERVEIKVVENRGRDIAPLVVDFAPMIKDFDYICHIHTKKSLYSQTEQVEWRNYLYDMLLGSKDRVHAILSVFETDPSIGAIYPEAFSEVPYWAYTWLSNKGIASSLLQKMGIKFDPDEYIDFPAGSMFWARREALEPLLKLGLRSYDFPEELGQTDGTLHHTIERCFTIAGKKKGLDSVVILDNKKHIFSYRSSKNLPQYMSASFEDKMIDKLPLSKVVSFDLFDTLLIRPFADPDMVFSFLEERITEEFGVKGFRKLRKEAENVARERKHYQHDVKLSEIYSVLSELAKINTSVVKEIQKLEVSTEKNLLEPRKNTVDIFKKLKDSNKRLILVSDTYLERDNIEEIISAKNINFFDTLYVSCEIGKRKDRGDLWEHVLMNENVRKENILHVGDNEQSDVQALVDRRFMHPVHVMKPSILFRQSKIGDILWRSIKPYNGWRENLLYGMVSNFYCSDPVPSRLFEETRPLSDPFALGYIIFGPIVFSFLSWLIKASERDRIKHIAFVAREGYLLHKAFEIMIDHPSLSNAKKSLPRGSYFLCSRRAAMFAAIKTEEDIGPLLGKKFNGNLRSFFENRLNVTDMKDVEKIIGTEALDQTISIPKDYNNVYRNVVKVFDVLARESEKERAALIQYCTEQGLADSENIGLVDIGYSGSIQKALVSILGNPLLTGYYFVTDKSASTLNKYGATCHAYFGEFIDPVKNDLPIFGYSLLMEAVLTSPTGQLLRFKKDVSGVVPVFKYPGISQKEFDTIDAIHKGCLRFIGDMMNLFRLNALEIEFPKDLIQRNYMLIINNDLDLGSLKSALSVEDEFCGNDEINVLEWYRKGKNGSVPSFL